ncbi:DNA topoisomerase, type II [Skeletonema marinoi]|uniref:DNA topoisomerase 2 n=1 Tax=Skeletonema marinoi TaxID=267567 RepID=A0AAD8Y9R7_9STRA|nr:DNA topoisomerase, type II [Skeletonema marinoi]
MASSSSTNAAAAQGGKSSKKTIEQTYQKKTQLEHILLRPDTYIGSTEQITQSMFVLNSDTHRIESRDVTFTPGFYKIFDEIIVNAADNKQRDPNMDRMEVVVDSDSNTISVMNNGKGIPVQIHKEHNCYVPTLIFGHLLTGSNFDDDEKKTTGGRNGYGGRAKDIKVYFLGEEKGDYTKITFRPDLDKFNMKNLDDDAKIPVKDFKSYLALFDDVEMPTAYDNMDNFEVGVTVSADGCFQQISFVNGIATTKGGGHVNFVADKVAKHIQPIVNKKNKGGSNITPAQIKNHLSVFVNCLIMNPTFDSQTKENLTTKPSVIGKEVTLSDKFLKQIEKSGIVESSSAETKRWNKEDKLTGIDKLDDANHAGTAKSKDCTLIITEGDSAKSLAMSGLSVVGRDFYGVFPLKGKPLNVRDATHAQIMKNQEIKNLLDIMGLKFGTTYDESNIKSLRYGHLMIMADQDHDGSHIKGLVINFIHHFWPSLLDVPGFLQQFITPIVKCTKGKKIKTFFTLPEYEEWKESTGNDAKGWTTKYYKGLGTSTSAEAKEYFSNLKIHEIHFNSLSDDIISVDDDMEDEPDADAPTTGSDLIDMAFAKKKVAERKQWLGSIDKDTFLNYSEAQKYGVNYSDFVNKELSLFSNYDNFRSIAHVMDGLKPSQRKILFSCFKKKLNKEMKVAQLSGYIGEHSAYHHGEASLAGAIIAMAQTYVGSNNTLGWKGSCSARYIFTRLEKFARAIFHPDDDALLNFLNDDGISIEPEYYMPIIPLILVNGSEGIGTGYSSTVHNHDPCEVIANLRKMINGEEPEMMHPCYYGFTGEIIIGSKEGGKYTIAGKIEPADWKVDPRSQTFLEEMMTGTDKSPSEIIDFKEHHTDTSVAFTITASKENIDEFEKEKGGLLGKFKLSKAISSTNMTLFDVDGKIHKYNTTSSTRLLRQTQGHAPCEDEERTQILSNKERFIEEVCEGDLVVSNRKRAELLSELSEREYDLCPKDEKMISEEEDGDDDETMEDTSSDSELVKGYEYLLGLKLWTLTFERAEDIRRQKGDKEAEVVALESTSPESIWLSDLDELDTALVERNKSIEAKKAIRSQSQPTSKKRATKQTKTKAVAKKTTKSKKEADEWNSELEESDSDGAGSDSEDDFFENNLNESPPKKVKTTDRVKTSSSKSSIRLSANGKQKVAVLGTRTQQRKSMSASKAKSSVTEMLIDSDSDESPKKLPAKKKKAARRKKSIVKEALQAEVELVDSDESPKNMPAKKKSSLSKSKASRHPKPEKISKKKATKRSSKAEKSICHFSSESESDGYESPEGDMSVDKPATSRGRKSLSKPKYTFEDSDEDDFEF